MEKCEACLHPTHKLVDWVDGVPDAWDYEAVLREHGVIVADLDTDPDDPLTHNGCQLSWKNGVMHIPTCNPIHARKAAALFVELWLRGVSASFADKLMDGYLYHLELQEN